VNPAFLRPLFQEKYRGAKIVFLHASYPYVRTLGYLASVYPNVYADFGLAIPFVAGDARGIVRELLGSAPASKVLYSSDAFHIPELYYLGAVMGRRALGEVLAEYVADGLIDEATAWGMAELILHQNAERVYEL
jgi:predicted TIM-barrel fold metal-dependent hydrolase